MARKNLLKGDKFEVADTRGTARVEKAEVKSIVIGQTSEWSSLRIHGASVSLSKVPPPVLFTWRFIHFRNWLLFITHSSVMHGFPFPASGPISVEGQAFKAKPRHECPVG